MKKRILVVDDEPGIHASLQMTLEPVYEVLCASNAQEGLARFRQELPSLVLLDVVLPGSDGLGLLQSMRSEDPTVPVIMLTAVKMVKTAVEAMKIGAADYLTKPFDVEELRLIVAKALATQALEHEVRHLRRERPFIAINCASIPDTLIESELFGHEKGAFTGALARRLGKVELAHGGTLFLDEVGDLGMLTQAKLLRFLQEREFTRVGGTQVIKVDVRIIAATNKILEDLVPRKEFREDLYYRINVAVLFLAPLRDRRDDIPYLSKHFLAKRLEAEERPPLEISKEAMELLMRYHWPGNIRELENVIEQAIVWCRGTEITTDHLPTALKTESRHTGLRQSALAGHVSLEKAVQEFERELILDALTRTGHVQTHAAALLGITRRMLKYRMDMLGIKSPDSQAAPGPKDVPSA